MIRNDHMGEASLQSYGAWIRKKRKERGLSIRQVSEATRIDEQYLKALEAGNIALLPEPYMRAFLKTYASFLGLDPEEAMHRFEVFLREQSDRLESVRGSVREREVRQARPQAVGPPMEEVDDGAASLPQMPEVSTRFGMLIAAAMLVFFVIVVYLAVLFTGGDAGSNLTGPTGVDTTEPLQQPEQAIPSPESAGPVVPVPVTTDTSVRQLFLANAMEETWMEAIADGAAVVSQIVTRGNQVRITFRDSLMLKLGKNRGMRLFLNGEEITDLGSPGRILRLVLTPAGVAHRRLTYPPDSIPDILNRPPPL